MPVAYNQRTLPLSPNAAKPEFSAGLVLAWDFTGVGALAEGEAWIYKGATNPALVKSGTQTLTTAAGEPGRVAGPSSAYDYTNLTDYGLQFGTGDFTVAIRFTTPATLPTGGSSMSRSLFQSLGSAGSALRVFVQENNGVGWYLSATGSTAAPLGTGATGIMYPPNSRLVVVIKRVAGSLSIVIGNADNADAPAVRYHPGPAATVPWDATWGARAYINSTTSSVFTSIAMQSLRVWDRALDDATVHALTKDYWSAEANNEVIDSIAITSPANGATISTSAVISGTYTGDAPTGVQVQHGSGAWVSGTSMTMADGAWSGVFAQTAGAANTLKARQTNKPAVVSPTVTGIVVAAPANSIRFLDYVDAGFVTQECPVPFRAFQRDANNAASVRIKLTYVGSPSAIQWRWDSSAWATLDAAPAGGVVDKVVTLQGWKQGALEVRFANDTATFASLEAVAVADVFAVMGQSNHEGGGAADYVAPIAPAANAHWKAPILPKNHIWRANVETPALPFSDGTGVVYPTQGSGKGYGSYFGRLATLIMAVGGPVAFVPMAKGSTSLSNWGVNTSTTQLYGAALATMAKVGNYKAVLWWQGEYETDDGSTRQYHENALNAIVNDWFTRTGKKWMLCNLNESGRMAGSGGTGPTDTGLNAIRAAIASVGATNPNVIGVADMAGTYTGSSHYSYTTDIINVAQKTYDVLNTAYAYSAPPADSTKPTLAGVITESNVTASGFTHGCPVASDNVAVAGYESSIDGGTNYTDRGMTRTATETGRPASTAHPVRWRAYDAAGLRSDPLSRTITTLAAASTVTGVSVSPTTATGSQTFTASVSGTNSPSQAVTWTASAGTISSGGIFTAPAATSSVQTVTITARSVEDTTKAGTATVTIAAAAPAVEGIQVGPSCTVNFGGTNRGLAGDPAFKNNKWLVPKDPDDKRWYKFGLAKDLTEAGTTISTATAIFDGVDVLVQPAIQGTDVVVKLGGLDLSANAENFCTIRAICANGEQIDRTMWFVREDH